MRSRVGSKGRITLPQRVREVLGVEPGDEVEFVIRGGQVFLRPRQEVPLENLFGRLKVGRLPGRGGGKGGAGTGMGSRPERPPVFLRLY